MKTLGKIPKYNDNRGNFWEHNFYLKSADGGMSTD